MCSNVARLRTTEGVHIMSDTIVWGVITEDGDLDSGSGFTCSRSDKTYTYHVRAEIVQYFAVVDVTKVIAANPRALGD